jgi:hypothetical protein
MTIRAEFVEPMLALAVAKLPEGLAWSYEPQNSTVIAVCVDPREHSKRFPTRP